MWMSHVTHMNESFHTVASQFVNNCVKNSFCLGRRAGRSSYLQKYRRLWGACMNIYIISIHSSCICAHICVCVCVFKSVADFEVRAYVQYIMYKFTHTQVYTYILVYPKISPILTCVCEYFCVHIHHQYTLIYICTHTLIHICLFNSYIYIYIYAHIHMYRWLWGAYICYVYSHTHIYIHIRVYSQVSPT